MRDILFLLSAIAIVLGIKVVDGNFNSVTEIHAQQQVYIEE